MPLLPHPDGQSQFRSTSYGPPSAGTVNGVPPAFVQSPPGEAGATSVRVTPLIVAFNVPVAAPALTRTNKSIGQLVAPASVVSEKKGDPVPREHDARLTAQTACTTGAVSVPVREG